MQRVVLQYLTLKWLSVAHRISRLALGTKETSDLCQELVLLYVEGKTLFSLGRFGGILASTGLVCLFVWYTGSGFLVISKKVPKLA